MLIKVLDSGVVNCIVVSNCTLMVKVRRLSLYTTMWSPVLRFLIPAHDWLGSPGQAVSHAPRVCAAEVSIEFEQ